MRNFLLFIVLNIPLLLHAQITTQSVKTNIENYGANLQQERIYIHFDKAAYTPGETIWFKAYLMEGVNISDISKNFYFDFCDADGNVIVHGIAPVIQSSAKGEFTIPENYHSQIIHVTAYTKWMLNFDSAFLYNKDIKIVQKNAAAATAVKNNAVIQFFPESGDWMEGTESKIAFKANYQNGLPVNAKGTIINNKGVTVAKIETMHDGMGFFTLMPVSGETYTAKWKDDNNVAYQTTLPVAKKNGAVLEIKPAQGKAGFVIKRTENATANFMQMHIVATMQQQLVYMAAVKLDASPITGGAIATDQLPSGILQITLFDSAWIEVAERICFINNDEYHFEPEAGFSVLGLGKRRNNTLVINVPDSIEANLSVSVTDADLGVDSSDDIISHLLLTGDLRGSVYHPSFYFSNTSDSVQQYLDLVMLTNGWRKIKWEDVINGEIPVPKFKAEDSYLTFSGKVFGTTPEDLREGVNILMIMRAKDSTQQNMIMPVNNDGSFGNQDMVLFDTLKVYYQFAGKNNLNNVAEVTFGNGSLQSPRKVDHDRNNFKNFFRDTAAENRLKYFYDQQARAAELLKKATLQEVVVTTKAKTPEQILDEKYTSSLFEGGDAVQFDVTTDPFGKNAYSVFNFLQGRVAGLTISIPGGSGNPSATWRGSTPQIYLNEAPIDISQAANISMTDVAYVKVFKPPFMGAFSGGAGGAIAIYTKKGGDIKSAGPSKKLQYKLVTGYSPQKEFYSPNYGTIDERNEQPDYRTTLYWNPMILTNAQNHIIKIPFYNNDITNGFRIIVEGVSKDGKLARIEKVVE